MSSETCADRSIVRLRLHAEVGPRPSLFDLEFVGDKTYNGQRNSSTGGK